MTDSTEFEVFIRAYQQMVFSTAVRLLGNETDALDMAQEVFIRAHRYFGTLRENPAAGGWLKKVTTNLCLNHITRYKARWRLFSELAGEGGLERLEGLFSPVDQTEHQDQDEESFRRLYLEKALHKLPAAQRVPLVLYHFEEMSYEEISSKLGVSLSKVKTDIHRGRRSLRRWLNPNLGEWDAPERNAGERGTGGGYFGQTRLAEGF